MAAAFAQANQYGVPVKTIFLKGTGTGLALACISAGGNSVLMSILGRMLLSLQFINRSLDAIVKMWLLG